MSEDAFTIASLRAEITEKFGLGEWNRRVHPVIAPLEDRPHTKSTKPFRVRGQNHRIWNIDAGRYQIELRLVIQKKEVDFTITIFVRAPSGEPGPLLHLWTTTVATAANILVESEREGFYAKNVWIYDFTTVTPGLAQCIAQWAREECT